MQPDVQELYDRLVAALDSDIEGDLASVVANLRPADIAEAMDLLDGDQRSRMIYAMPPRLTAEVVIELDEAVRDSVVEELDKAQLGEIVAELSPDDAADMMADMAAEDYGEVLEKVPVEHSNQISELLRYEEDSAGGIMNPRLLSLRGDQTVGEAIEAVRAFVTEEQIHYVYIVGVSGMLEGIVPLRQLVIHPANTTLHDICDRDPITVDVSDDQESVLNVMRKYDVAAVPVVDSAGELRGRITHDDVMDVATEEADEDIYRMAGTDAAELETTSSFRAARVRMGWLIPCIFGTLAAGGVIAMFGETDLSGSRLDVLLMFVPMIAATSGNAGIQTATIVLRGFATGDLAGSKLRVVFSREVRIAILVGVLCATMTGGLTALMIGVMKGRGYTVVMPDEIHAFRIGISVSLGMLCAIGESVSFGIALPFLFKRVGVDPAIASGPLITSANDLLSVSVYLGIALLILY